VTRPDEPKEVEEVRSIVNGEAGRAVNVIALPFDSDRGALFGRLATANMSLMLSWHEGFGLTGWEAIGCEVPLILGRQTGLHDLIQDRLGGRGLGCVYVIDVMGPIDPDTHFNKEDVDKVANAILTIAGDLPAWRKNAVALRRMLNSEGFGTWTHAAQQFVKNVCAGQGHDPSFDVSLHSTRQLDAPQPLSGQVPLGKRQTKQALDRLKRLANAFPASYTALYGRGPLVTEYSSLLTKADTRGLAITAMGGMGKTALAHEVCLTESVWDAFDLVLGTHATRRSLRAPIRTVYGTPIKEEHEGVSTLADFMSVVAEQLGIVRSSFNPATKDADTEDEICSKIGAQRALFVLDNLETMEETSYVVAALHRMCRTPNQKVLLTARWYRGDFPPPFEYRVLLPIDKPEDCVSLVESKLLDHDGRPGTYRGPAIDQIVDISGGHPLALELLAGMLNTQGPQSILTLFQQRNRRPSAPLDDDYINALLDFVFDQHFQTYIGPDGAALLAIISRRSPYTEESHLRNAAARQRGWSDRMFAETLGRLLETNCVTRLHRETSTWLAMHPLTRTFIRSKE